MTMIISSLIWRTFTHCKIYLDIPLKWSDSRGFLFALMNGHHKQSWCVCIDAEDGKISRPQIFAFC